MLDRSARGLPTAVLVDESQPSRRGGKPGRATVARKSETEVQQKLIVPPPSDGSPTTAAAAAAAVTAADATSNPDTRRTVSLDSIRRSLATPERIREAMLLQVILSKPAALRRFPGPRA